MQQFDLTPAPNVLIALTHNPMQPLDALCELIDNAIDSFSIARLVNNGQPNRLQVVSVHLPRLPEVEAGLGIIRIQDNGPGMTREQASNAIKAGFSGNNPYDSLGLFGMGFNIATGKLGRSTRLITARADDAEALEVSFDLEEIVRSQSYIVPTVSTTKPDGLPHGTIIEVNNWWPQGNGNHGFINKLLRYGITRIRKEIGKRYSSILRDGKTHIQINGEPCPVAEHCRWGDARFVTRQGSKIPAVIYLDEQLGSQKRCTECYAMVPEIANLCPNTECGSASFRSIEERVKGWIGIQRYDDKTDYGIDLIRNGRTIRVAEKPAFFEYTNEFKETIKDYPVDSIFGRIIGELHLNHVPVDFLKQDFQRSSPEWQRAMTAIRGDSSLQPKQPGANANNSPLYKLYQAFRRVRRFGSHDLYMGYWPPGADIAQRIPRETEKEFRERFERKEPGYYDDFEWYKLVLDADTPPLEHLSECPTCHNQVLEGQDFCAICNAPLATKSCLNNECNAQIPANAASCPDCGSSQVLEVGKTWHCRICKATNSGATTECDACGAVAGSEDPVSPGHLRLNSVTDADLSIASCTVTLPSGKNTTPFRVTSYAVSRPIKPFGATESVPVIVHRTTDLEIFIDLNHPIFRALHVRPEEVIAAEVASFIISTNPYEVTKSAEQLNLANVQWTVLHKYWQDRLYESPERLKGDTDAFFDELLSSLPDLLMGLSEDVFTDLSESDKKALSDNLIDAGQDITTLGQMIQNGLYLRYLPTKATIALFANYPERFFDGHFWSAPYVNLPGELNAVADQIKERTRKLYSNCLEDLVATRSNRTPQQEAVMRARLSLSILQAGQAR